MGIEKEIRVVDLTVAKAPLLWHILRWLICGHVVHPLFRFPPFAFCAALCTVFIFHFMWGVDGKAIWRKYKGKNNTRERSLCLWCRISWNSPPAYNSQAKMEKWKMVERFTLDGKWLFSSFDRVDGICIKQSLGFHDCRRNKWKMTRHGIFIVATKKLSIIDDFSQFSDNFPTIFQQFSRQELSLSQFKLIPCLRYLSARSVPHISRYLSTFPLLRN